VVNLLLPGLLILTFTLLSLLHIAWACGGTWGRAAAVPEWNNRPAFTPSRFATVLVAMGLADCAVLVAALAGWLPLPLGAGLLKGLGYAISLVFLARAIGDFHLVGFFKRVRGTRFASLDTSFYSPLCLGLALGVLWLLHAGRN
jgi:hypothetical protein